MRTAKTIEKTKRGSMCPLFAIMPPHHSQTSPNRSHAWPSGFLRAALSSPCTKMDHQKPHVCRQCKERSTSALAYPPGADAGVLPCTALTVSSSAPAQAQHPLAQHHLPCYTAVMLQDPGSEPCKQHTSSLALAMNSSRSGPIKTGSNRLRKSSCAASRQASGWGKTADGSLRPQG